MVCRRAPDLGLLVAVPARGSIGGSRRSEHLVVNPLSRRRPCAGERARAPRAPSPSSASCTPVSASPVVEGHDGRGRRRGLRGRRGGGDDCAGNDANTTQQTPQTRQRVAPPPRGGEPPTDTVVSIDPTPGRMTPRGLERCRVCGGGCGRCIRRGSRLACREAPTSASQRLRRRGIRGGGPVGSNSSLRRMGLDQVSAVRDQRT